LRVSNVAGRLHFEPEIASELAAIEAELSELAKSVHDLSRLLHPAALSQLGLEAALEAECATFSRLRGITVKFSAENVPDSLSDAIAFCLYRVAQEALQNIRKHAEAKTASVTLSRTAQGIVMVIRDSGKGFDINAARGKGGVGLVSMEERVRMAKGSILVNSKAGEGTQVEVCVPMVG
jgi:signal transduction histidine kinase